MKLLVTRLVCGSGMYSRGLVGQYRSIYVYDCNLKSLLHQHCSVRHHQSSFVIYFFLPEVLTLIKSSQSCEPPTGEEQYLHSPMYSLRVTVSGLVSAQLGAPKATRYVNKPNMRHKAEILGHGEPSIKPIVAYLCFLL